LSDKLSADRMALPRYLIAWVCVLSAAACAGKRASAPANAPAPSAAAHVTSNAAAPFSLRPKGTSQICDLIGLGAVGSVPYNFPGADRDYLARHRELSPRIPEASLPPGGNRAVPSVLGADMGAPFLHADGRLYFTFDDAVYPPAEGTRPGVCPKGTAACPAQIVNDDLLASASLTAAAAPACIGLQIEHARNAEEFAAITWDGAVGVGGHALGPQLVPGPGFSTGKFIFLLVPQEETTCRIGSDDCVAQSGIVSDRCLSDPGAAGTAHCYFGPCSGALDSPCALRLLASTLLVRAQGSQFVTPKRSVHLTSDSVLTAYRGHFSTVSFAAQVDFATGEGKVWVIGRDSFWGEPGLTMSPYLMFHPVHQGKLDAPLYFAGMTGAAPSFVADPAQARPIYAENEFLPHHTSLAFMPEFGAGTWLMIYGGHAQPSLRSIIERYLRPAPDPLFFDRTTGVFARTAPQPWGPWSEPQLIFNPYLPEYPGYCRTMYFDDPSGRAGFNCPAELRAHNAELNRTPMGMGGEYGAAIVPGSVRQIDADTAAFRWLLSTWNPYRVMLLETRVQFGK
jgi:hypothetical protein